MGRLTHAFVVAVCLLMISGFAPAQEGTSPKTPAKKTGSSDAAYIAKALTAAPAG